MKASTNYYIPIRTKQPRPFAHLHLLRIPRPTQSSFKDDSRFVFRRYIRSRNSIFSSGYLLKGRIVPARGPPVFGKSSCEASCKRQLFSNWWLGWEPIFEHEGETLAEMAHEKKVWATQSFAPNWSMELTIIQNKLSHRYKALLKFQEWLATRQFTEKWIPEPELIKCFLIYSFSGLQ